MNSKKFQGYERTRYEAGQPVRVTPKNMDGVIMSQVVVDNIIYYKVLLADDKIIDYGALDLRAIKIQIKRKGEKNGKKEPANSAKG